MKVLVLGCGPSARMARLVQGRVPIWGCNDAWRNAVLDYLVVLDGPTSFHGVNRLPWVVCAIPRVECFYWHQGFEHLATRAKRAVQVQLEVIPRIGVPIHFEKDRKVLPHMAMSPWAAICLAWQQGATDIGVLGVDLTPEHPLQTQFENIQESLLQLSLFLQSQGCQLVNLSPTSRVVSLRRMDLLEWGGYPLVRHGDPGLRRHG